MALSKADKHVLATAGKGKVAFVLDEEPGYPVPSCGARYCQRIKGRGWIHTMFGNAKVLKMIADDQNAHAVVDAKLRDKAPVMRLVAPTNQN